jgi:hypothetical protein
MFRDPNWQIYEIIEKLMLGDGHALVDDTSMPKPLIHLWFPRGSQ